MCVEVRWRPVYCFALHVSERLCKLTKEAFCIFSSMLIARNNIKDVRFLCLSILHYNKFRNITREHGLLRRSKVEAG